MILVTGGGGYVGRNVARRLANRAIVLDDFRNSWLEAVPSGIAYQKHDLATALIAWDDHEAVIHCAGSVDAAQSVKHPAMYWWNNVGTPMAFFQGAVGKPVVVSSTLEAAAPVTPYGQTLQAAEKALREAGVKLAVLRLACVSGGDQIHRHETQLIPTLLRAALTGEPVPLHGDGSAVRDYVHVEDVARAHVEAVGKAGVYELGSGRVSTVLEVVETARRVTGRKIEVVAGPALPKEPPGRPADLAAARKDLGWAPRRSLEEIVASAWEWRQAHPNGY
jgi:nucleoside-diphosphate-sugar epimerase